MILDTASVFSKVVLDNETTKETQAKDVVVPTLLIKDDPSRSMSAKGPSHKTNPERCLRTPLADQDINHGESGIDNRFRPGHERPTLAVTATKRRAVDQSFQTP